ncbi:MAG: protein phosphatase 2C domain-containing protein, partial [Chitinophagaceae bacterium]|nr:protein phosphatase 2C domain-containing protein [Chitinophagaceae bacterium]
MAENYFGITDTGKVRVNNEDTFIAETLSRKKLVVACVIDGVGGYSGGEVASDLARQAILDHLKIETADCLSLVKDAFIAANNVVFKERHLSNQNSEMACVATLALVDIESNKFYYAHVGDTRLYLYRDNTLVKISHDHSFVGFLEDSGRLNEAEAMNHAKRNEINKALGFSNTLQDSDYIETGESPFLPNDMLLLCSDGLSDLMNREAMVSILKSNDVLSKKGALLIDGANAAGGKDNITVVLVKNDKTVAKHTATKPAAVSEKAIATEPKDPIQTIYKSPEADRPILQKKRSSAVPVLTFLWVLLLGAFIWLFVQYYQNKNKAANLPEAVVNTSIKKSDREIQLLQSIGSNKANEVFIVNAATDQPIVISDSILLQQDTLH